MKNLVEVECEECGLVIPTKYVKFVSIDNDLPLCPECYEVWTKEAQAEFEYEEAMYNEARRNAIGEI